MSINNNNNINKIDSLLLTLIPKIKEYFSENKTLNYENLLNFLNFIDFSIFNTENELENLWNCLISSENKSQEINCDLIIKNLSKYIKENFEDSENNYNSNSNNSSIIKTDENKIDFDDESKFELCKLLSALEFSDKKNICLKNLYELLDKYKFINLEKNDVANAINEFNKEKKIDEINKEFYFDLLEKFNFKYLIKIKNDSQKNFSFADYELNYPETDDFIYLNDYINILFSLNSSLTSINNKIFESIKTNINDLDFYLKYFNTIQNNIQFYLFEILKLFNEQNQKFEFYNDKISTKINTLKTEKNNIEKIYLNYKNETEQNPKENLSSIYEELENVKNQNNNLTNTISQLNNELNKKDKKEIELNNKIFDYESNKLQSEKQLLNLQTEFKKLNENFTVLQNNYNSQLLKKKTLVKSQTLKSFQNNLNLQQKNLINMNYDELINYIIEKDKNFTILQNKNQNLNNKILDFEKEKTKFKENFQDLKQENLKLKLNVDQFRENNDKLQKELEELKSEKNNNENALNNYLNDSFQSNDNNKNFKIEVQPKKNEIENFNFFFISNNKIPFEIIHNNNINIINNNKNKKKINFDFLLIKYNKQILRKLEDRNSNLIFSDKVFYYKEIHNKNPIECILIITESFFYLFNKTNYQKSFILPLINLNTIDISTNNNFIHFEFNNNIFFYFEIFRILELIDYFKNLNILNEQHKYEIKINSNKSIPKKSHKNFMNSPFFGKCIYSTFIKKKTSGLLQPFYPTRFLVLCDLGLLILESPHGKPLEIVNPLFSKQKEYEDHNNNLCYEIIIKKDSHIFIFETDFERKIFDKKIHFWCQDINENFINYVDNNINVNNIIEINTNNTNNDNDNNDNNNNIDNNNNNNDNNDNNNNDNDNNNNNINNINNNF